MQATQIVCVVPSFEEFLLALDIQLLTLQPSLVPQSTKSQLLSVRVVLIFSLGFDFSCPATSSLTCTDSRLHMYAHASASLLLHACTGQVPETPNG